MQSLSRLTEDGNISQDLAGSWFKVWRLQLGSLLPLHVLSEVAMKDMSVRCLAVTPLAKWQRREQFKAERTASVGYSLQATL